MPQLDPTWFASQLFWLAIGFTLLYVLLSRCILPPLMDVMGSRTRTREGDIELAQSLKVQAEQARQDYERTLAEARARTQQLMADSANQQKRAAEQAMRELDAQIAKKLADAESAIAAEKRKLLDELAPASAELASGIVEKLTMRAPAGDVVRSALAQLHKRNG